MKTFFALKGSPLSRVLLVVAGTAAASLGSIAPAHAGFTTTANPDANYLASTTKLTIGSAIGTDITSLGDGALTVGFSLGREVHAVPSGGWSSWSSSPYSESATPTVLTAVAYSAADITDTLSFSSPLSMFGLEIEPDTYSNYSVTATFLNGVNTVGSITQTINGTAGARLFAGMATGTDSFTRVVITSTDDMAFAQLRYALVPEPSTYAMILGGLGLLIGAQRVRRSARA